MLNVWMRNSDSFLFRNVEQTENQNRFAVDHLKIKGPCTKLIKYWMSENVQFMCYKCLNRFPRESHHTFLQLYEFVCLHNHQRCALTHLLVHSITIINVCLCSLSQYFVRPFCQSHRFSFVLKPFVSFIFWMTICLGIIHNSLDIFDLFCRRWVFSIFFLYPTFAFIEPIYKKKTEALGY